MEAQKIQLPIQQVGMVGEITAKWYDQTTLMLWEKYWNRFVIFAGLDKKKWYRLGELKRQDVKKNIIATVGMNVLTRLLTNDTTYTGFINKMALGSGAATPAIGDVKLVTEVYRNTTASQTAQDNIAYLTAFYSETETSGTYTEFGNFIDGTGTVDSGQLWSHITVSWTKTTAEVLVVDCKYTFANA